MNKQTVYAVFAFAAGMLLAGYIPYSNIIAWVLVGVGIVGLLQK